METGSTSTAPTGDSGSASGSEVSAVQLDSQSLESSGQSSGQQQVEQLAEEVQAAKDAGASAKEIKQMIKEFELKVNGKTVKTKIDLADEKAIIAELQKAHAFGDVSQENSKIKKALGDKIAIWKKDPEQALRDLGIDPDEFVDKAVERKVENLKKTPEQLEREREKAELAAYKEREEKFKEQLRQQEEAKKDQEALSVLKTEIKGALDSHPSIKHNEYTERRVADLMAYFSEKYPDVTAEQVLPTLEAELEKEFNSIIDSMPDAALERFVGKRNVERIASKFAPKPAPKPAPKAPVAPTNPSQAAKPTAQGAISKEPPKKRSFEDMMRKR